MTQAISCGNHYAEAGIKPSIYRKHKADFTIVGVTSMREIYAEDLEPDDKALVIDNSYFEVDNYINIAYTIGYFPVSETELIRVVTRIPLLIAAAVILLLLAIALIASRHVSRSEQIFSYVNSMQNTSIYESSPAGTIETSDADNTAGSESSSAEEALNGNLDPTIVDETISPDDNTTSIPVYPEIYVTEAQPIIPLNNPEENTVYFEYVITENGKQLYESNLISPGKYVEWNAYSDLDQGDHDLIMQINCYDLTNQSPCNGSSVSCVVHCN